MVLQQSSWIANNWPGVVSAVIAVVTAIGVLAKLLSMVSSHERTIERLLLKLEVHTSDTTLHRTPDFEKRLDELNHLLKEIKLDVSQLLRKENER